MNKADIKIKNGYGIENFAHEFLFDGNAEFPHQNTNIIYAQNGVMKSSFAKTLRDYSKGMPIKDHIFDTAGICEIRDSTGAVSPERIFSVASFDNGEYESSKMANLLVSTSLQEEYQELMDRFNTAYLNLMNKVKSVSGASARDSPDDLLEQICAQYGVSVPRTPLGLINIIKSNRSEIESQPDFVQRTKVTVSGSKDAVKFAEDNRGIISDLMSILDEVKESASFVRGKFDSGNANKLIEAVDKSGFLDVEHELVLLNKSTNVPEAVVSIEDLKAKLTTDLDRILDQKPTLKAKFLKMVKDLSTDSRNDFKKILEDNETKDIILLMGNPAVYLRKIWEAYLKGCLVEADALIDVQEDIHDEVERITELAKNERTDWDKVVAKFNKRFRNLPYTIGIENKASVILDGVETPRPVITYKKGASKKDFQTLRERQDIASLLSTGEKKALFLLNVMFEIEATVKESEPFLVVLDDIVDSFDYKNKYAFLEYIYEVSKYYENVRLIVLTHNYDFFRLLQSRLYGENYRDKSWFALKGENTTKLVQAEYIKLFKYMRSIASATPEVWLAMIPFARNLHEYRSNDVSRSREYITLTECLHDLNVSHTIAEILPIITTETGVTGTPFSGSDDYHESLLMVADDIAAKTVEGINLHYNLVLMMATRIYAERYMKSKLEPSVVAAVLASGGIFTRRIFDATKEFGAENDQTLELLDEVNLITPEHIHVNSFMYEPLLDIGFYEVKDLYTKIKALALS